MQNGATLHCPLILTTAQPQKEWNHDTDPDLEIIPAMAFHPQGNPERETPQRKKQVGVCFWLDGGGMYMF
jgi:hypothetical protein